MINLTNQILELQNGKKFFVVRQASFRKKTYFFAAEVTEDEEDFTNKFIFLERVDDSDDGESFSVQEVTDDETLRVLAKNIKLD
jgi:hypothetical protein